MTSYRGQKRSIFVADFETTTVETDCRVWSWGIVDIEADLDSPDCVQMSETIETFVAYVAQTNSVTFFHNLAFDGSFIIDWLFRHGFSHVKDRPRKGEFTSLISSMGKFYNITVKWFNGRQTEFRDSMKKLPMSVANVAKAFKLDEGKGEIDYHLTRPVGWIMTEQERDYLRRDVVIVAKAIKIQIDAGMTKLTVGSDSLAEYKAIIGKRMFTRLFPVLPNSMDLEIRRAYRGGFAYVDPRRQNVLTGAGRVFDVNSLYPSVMYDRLLPYGEPLYVNGLPVATQDYPLFLVSITFTATIKPDHIPCIQIKNSYHFAGTEYQTVITDPVTMMVSNVDLDLWNEQYDLNILSYNGGWKFNAVAGLFTKYIDKWMKVKAESEGGLRAIAKLHLNSLYGKFATNPNVTPKIPIMDNNVVKLVIGEEETRDPVYTAMGVFITAYARDVTIRAAQKHYDTFVYADTDSLHLLNSDAEMDLDVHKSRLGAWKIEYDFEQGMFVRAKCYTETVLNIPWSHESTDRRARRYVTHIAGLPVSAARHVTFDSYVDGAKFSGKLLPKRVTGGIVLQDVKFTLNL